MIVVLDLRRFRKVFLCTALFFALALLTRFLLLPALFPREYKELVHAAAQKYDLPPTLLYAVIHTESRFRPEAVSHKNASGLMQLTEGTGAWAAQSVGMAEYTSEDLFTPSVNIELGAWYLDRLLNQFQDETETALAAYNAGSGNVSIWLSKEAYSDDGVTLHTIPFPETKNYVKRVLRAQCIYAFLYE